MMDRGGSGLSWSNAGFRRSVIALAALTLASLLVGFIWLPSVQGDYSAQGLWTAICRAAGVPTTWGQPQLPAKPVVASQVVLERGMTRPLDPGAAGRGATLALNCTMCHGAQGAPPWRSTAPCATAPRARAPPTRPTWPASTPRW
jgi:hypothetical protein